ncbi:MAG: hypothetical protein EXS05_01275 [Planctomycetaceae bacterium]|nr:hypothetical protein [Planctomycetaceae bacterium]
MWLRRDSQAQTSCVTRQDLQYGRAMAPWEWQCTSDKVERLARDGAIAGKLASTPAAMFNARGAIDAQSGATL